MPQDPSETHSNVIDFAEWCKEKARDNKGNMSEEDMQMVEVTIDSVANAIIGIINIEEHLDRIATAMEKQVAIYDRITKTSV